MKFQILILLFITVVLFAFLIAQPISLIGSDLGRHIKNGEILVTQDWDTKIKLLTTNFYSATHPDFPFVNHHWLSGVLFYIVYSLSGFVGLSVFFILLSILTLIIFFHIAWRGSNFYIAILSTLITFPLLVSRTEVRPEILSYLLAGIFFWILFNYSQKKVSQKWLLVLPLLQILWVNLHILFIVGAVITFIFTLRRKTLIPIFVLVLASCLVNPNGIKGALVPLQIFGNYGISVQENQSILSMTQLPQVDYFMIVIITLLISFAILIYKRSGSFINLSLALFFGFLAFSMVRNLALFGFFALSIIAINFFQLSRIYKKKLHSKLILLLPLFIILAIFSLHSDYFTTRQIGIGLKQGDDRGGKYFLEQNLQGPIFNNFDIGNYLIFHLFPKEKPFTDGRPEAYAPGFFSKEYVAPDLNSFNTIFFSIKDQSAFARHFLTIRELDPKWIQVYKDESIVIFSKYKNPTND